MDSKAEEPRRRRGAALESALLDAAWAELDANGYAGLTMEAVAARARTSRPVIARRWPDRSSLALAAIRHQFETAPIVIPDTGSLRDDLLDLLRQVNATRSVLVAPLFLRFSGLMSEAEGGLQGLRDQLVGGRTGTMELLLERARQRGEIGAREVPPLVRELPIMLLRHELFMRLAPADDATLVSIVDDAFLPLVVPGPEPQGRFEA
jgi:AcrR family transcriptional regulator